MKVKEEAIKQELFRDNDYYESLEEYLEKGEDNEALFDMRDIDKVIALARFSEAKKVKPKKEVHKVQRCNDSEFHGVNCLEMGDELGFEGYYMGDLNHPDPRPGHAIWVNKKDAEKLWTLFNEDQTPGGNEL